MLLLALSVRLFLTDLKACFFYGIVEKRVDVSPDDKRLPVTTLVLRKFLCHVNNS